MTFSYLFGQLWYIFCELTKKDARGKLNENENNANFIDENSFNGISNVEKMITLLYFALTTLSTVGLGDYHPKSDWERLFCSFIFLFGIIVTSYIMDVLTKTINQVRDFNKDLDESD